MDDLIRSHSRLVGLLLFTVVIVSATLSAELLKHLVLIALTTTLLMYCFTYLKEDILFTFRWLRETIAGYLGGTNDPAAEAVSKGGRRKTTSAEAEPDDSDGSADSDHVSRDSDGSDDARKMGGSG